MMEGDSSDESSQENQYDVNLPVRYFLEERSILPDGTEVDNVRSFVADGLPSEITCPICLDKLEKTWVVMACLHRFCFDCIHKSLRMDNGPNSNKECPLCRVKLASRRDSCPDSNYDRIVNVFTENLTDVPSHKSGSTFDAAAYRKAHEENISTFRKRQQQYVMGNVRADKRNRTEPRGELQTVCLSLLPYQEQLVKAMQFLKKPYLSVPGEMRIEDMKRYLLKKPVCTSPVWGPVQAVQLSIVYKGERVRLGDRLTVRDVCMKYWERTAPFEILYEATPE